MRVATSAYSEQIGDFHESLQLSFLCRYGALILPFLLRLPATYNFLTALAINQTSLLLIAFKFKEKSQILMQTIIKLETIKKIIKSVSENKYMIHKIKIFSYKNPNYAYFMCCAICSLFSLISWIIIDYLGFWFLLAAYGILQCSSGIFYFWKSLRAKPVMQKNED